MKIWAIIAKHRLKVVIAAAMLASLYAVYSVSHQVGLSALEQEASRRLEHVANTLFVPVEKYSYLPEVVASQAIILDTLRDKTSPATIARANAYLESVSKMAKANAIYVMDQDGRTIAASNWNLTHSFVGQSYAFRPYFQDAIKGGRGKFYAMGTTSKAPGYYLSFPVKEDEKIVGVVAVKINLSNFDREWHENYNYEVSVTDEQGISFLSSVPDWKYRPMTELHPVTLEGLRRTRRYEASLKPPLPILERESRGDNSQYLVISMPDGSGHSTVNKSYVVKSGKLPWSAWEMNIFMPADQVRGEAIRHTLVAAALATILVLLLLSWSHARRRADEREKARVALEAAHTELEEKHRHLEVLSQELMRMASIDELTGSYNRRFFFEIGTKMVSGVMRHKLPLSVIVIDVDFFKRINDEYGHHAGDKVLRQISWICSSGLREEDIFARLGGEEFVMALMSTEGRDAMDIAERLRRQVMNHTFMEEGTAIQVTISCGVAQFHPSDIGIDGVVKRADKALYDAKKSGRNKIAVAAREGHEHAIGPASSPIA